MKLYEFHTTEHNGEQEYSHYHLVHAETLDEATEKARTFCSEWYGDENVENKHPDGGHEEWWFFGGGLILDLDTIFQTTIEEFNKRMFERCIICCNQPDEGKKTSGCHISGEPDTLEIIYQDIAALAADMSDALGELKSDNADYYNTELTAIYNRHSLISNEPQCNVFGYLMTEKQAEELSDALHEDIITRYDNAEYHNPDIIEEFAKDNGLKSA